MRTIAVPAFTRRLKEMLEEPDCKLVWFFGAGCSMSSGIPGAASLVELWLPRLKRREDGSDSHWRDWAAERYPRFDPADLARLYGVVLEELFPLPHERQQEVERLTSEKDPSIGYALFAVLAAHEDFGPRSNIVLTTNFDDLVSDALYLMTRKKPLVVSHDSLAPFVRSSRRRPLIVKVHGDARLAPRNTLAETSELDVDLAERVGTLFNGCALIFLGYGGNDESIRRLLNSAPRDGFPLGIYWVSQDQPAGSVGKWLSERADVRNDVFHVPHQDFDDLFLRLAEVLGLRLPDGSRLTQLFERYNHELSRREKAPVAASSTEEKERAGRARRGLDALLLANRASRTDETHATRDALYTQAVEADPTNPAVLGDYAVFLARDLKDFTRAEAMFERAIAADPDHANNLGNYAVFLADDLMDLVRAEAMFERAIAADPDHANNLGNYALFLADDLKDPVRAEAMFERAIAADPDHANHLANYAVFLADDLKDPARAEAMFERAIAADPDHANNLGNYALFLVRDLKDPARAEAIFERAIAADPDHAINLGNYALVLGRDLKDPARAEAMWERAIAADPDHANNLGGYALFLARTLKDPRRAEAIFERAIAADPNHANNAGNHLQLLWTMADDEDNPALVERCRELLRRGDLPPSLQAELLFYLVAHNPAEVPDTLKLLRRLLQDGASSHGWDFESDIAWAERHGDPRVEMLRLLSQVITGTASLDQMEKFPEWRALAD